MYFSIIKVDLTRQVRLWRQGAVALFCPILLYYLARVIKKRNVTQGCAVGLRLRPGSSRSSSSPLPFFLVLHLFLSPLLSPLCLSIPPCHASLFFFPYPPPLSWLSGLHSLLISLNNFLPGLKWPIPSSLPPPFNYFFLIFSLVPPSMHP